MRNSKLLVADYRIRRLRARLSLISVPTLFVALHENSGSYTRSGDSSLNKPLPLVVACNLDASSLFVLLCTQMLYSARRRASRGAPQLLVAGRDPGGTRLEYGGDGLWAFEKPAGEDGSFEEFEVSGGHLRVGEGEYRRSGAVPAGSALPPLDGAGVYVEEAVDGDKTCPPS